MQVEDQVKESLKKLKDLDNTNVIKLFDQCVIKAKKIVLQKFYQHIIDTEGNLDVDIDAKNSIIYGDCQTGKRSEILKVAFKNLNSERNVIIVTDNFKYQKTLMIGSIKKLIKYYVPQREKDQVTEFLNNINLFDIIPERGIAGPTKYGPMFPSISVCILNKTNLIKVNEFIENSTKEFCVIIDEADVGSIVEQRNITEAAYRKHELLKIIKHDRVRSVLVTATPFGFIAAELDYNLMTQDIYEIVPHEEFITQGHPNFRIHNIDDILETPEKRLIERDQVYESITAICKNRCTSYQWEGGSVTGVVLSVSMIRSHQKELKKCLKTHIPDSFFVMVNSGRVDIYYPYDFLQVMGSMVSVKNVCLSEVIFKYIQKPWLKSNIRNHYHMFIIGGKMIGRSTPCRAEGNRRPTNCHQFLFCPNQIVINRTSDKATIHQMATRTQGWYPTDAEYPDQPIVNLFANSYVIDVVSNYAREIRNQIHEFQQIRDVLIRKASPPVSTTFAEGARLVSARHIKSNPIYKKGDTYFVSKEAADHHTTPQVQGSEYADARPPSTTRLQPNVIWKAIVIIMIDNNNQPVPASYVIDTIHQNKCFDDKFSIYETTRDYLLNPKNIENRIYYKKEKTNNIYQFTIQTINEKKYSDYTKEELEQYISSLY